MTLLDKLIQKADFAEGLHYRNPPVPFTCGLPGGLDIGSKIYIRGIVVVDCSRFTINLQRGAHDEGADIYFHLNPCFPSDAGRSVIRNSRYQDEWGKEENSGESPFVPGKSFFIIITAYRNTYEVEINGDLFCTFTHRENLPLSGVTHLLIDGNVIIRALHIPVETMPKHLRLAIPGNSRVGDIYSIRGNVNHGAEKWVANIQCGPGKLDDIVFHFSPRFQDDKTVIRNTRADDSWGEEEKKGKMPFKDGQPFYFQISVASNGFRTRVDNNDFISFPHRLDVTSASVLFIEGDVSVEDVWIDSTASQLQPDSLPEGKKKNFQIPKLQEFFPDLPVIASIKGGLTIGQIIVISGIVDKEPERISVDLQCDICDNTDIALHYNPRWDSGDDIVVVNSCQDSQWGEEIQVKEKFPLAPGNHFEIQIICHNDNYIIVVNGVQNCTFPHRMDISRVDYVGVSGSLTVHRMIVA